MLGSTDIFDAARHDALVRLETTHLEQATGAVGYLIKEECNVGIIPILQFA